MLRSSSNAPEMDRLQRWVCHDSCAQMTHSLAMEFQSVTLRWVASKLSRKQSKSKAGRHQTLPKFSETVRSLHYCAYATGPAAHVSALPSDASCTNSISTLNTKLAVDCRMWTLLTMQSDRPHSVHKCEVGCRCKSRRAWTWCGGTGAPYPRMWATLP